MRLPTVLALAASLTLLGCGGDEEPEPQTTARPAPQRAPVDTTLGDTTAAPASDAQGAAGATGAAGAQGAAGGTDAPAGAAGAAPGAAGGGAAGADAPAGASGQRLYTVQVAAFLESETARAWESRLSGQGLPVWVSMAELGGQTFYRLRVGAVPTVSDARRLGRLITDRYEWPVWVAPLTPVDRLPDDAVENTRRLLDAG